MTVGLGQELHTACLRQRAEKFEHFGCVLLDKLQRNAADTEGYLEGLAVLLDHVEHRLQRRLVALLRQFGNDALVLVVVVVVMVRADVEETVALEVDGLVYLKVKANGFHRLMSLCVVLYMVIYGNLYKGMSRVRCRVRHRGTADCRTNRVR